MWKTIGKGVLWIFATFLLCKICMAFSWMIIACFLSVIMGVCMPIFATDKKMSGGGMIVGIFAVIFASIIPSILTNYKGFGSSEKNISLEQIQNYTGTTCFTLVDAHVEKDLKGFAVVMGRRSAVGSVYVWPIVKKGWTPDQEIFAWAVTDNEYDKRLDHDCMQGVQVVENEDNRDAVKDAMKGSSFPPRPKLKSSDKAIMLRWTCNASGEWKAELIKMVMFPFAFSIIYVFVVMIGYGSDKPEKKSAVRSSSRQ